MGRRVFMVAAAAISGIACGPRAPSPLTDSAPNPDSGVEAGVDSGLDSSMNDDSGGAGGDGGGTALDMRATTFNILSPSTLGLVNGVLAGAIDGESLNLLMRFLDLGTAPMMMVGDGDPGSSPGEYAFPPAGVTTFAATLDAGTRNLVTTSTGSVQIDLEISMTCSTSTMQCPDGTACSVDADCALLIPIHLVNASFDLFFDATYSEVLETDGANMSVVQGGLLVEEACAVNINIGAASLNLLDILDGGANSSANTTPGSCAAGTAFDNILPDLDTDGDGTADAYRVVARLAAVIVVITN